MHCSKCGKECEDKDLFCRFCGAEIENEQASRISEDIENVEPKIDSTPTTPRQTYKKWMLPMMLLIIVAVGVTILIIEHSNKRELRELEQEQLELSGMNVEDYFNQNSVVKNILTAKDSSDVHTEKEVEDEMKSRGFNQNSVYYEFSMKGKHQESTETNGSGKKHPVYQTYYVTDKGDIWTISDINGHITAYPVSFNLERDDEVEVIVSENDTLFSYDSIDNKYYETIPDSSVVDMRILENIDAKTLDGMTVEVLNAQ